MTVPRLGVGAVLVPGLEPLLEPGAAPLSVVEIEPQTRWVFNPRAPERYGMPVDALAALTDLPQKKLVHGVGFPVGGTQQGDPAHLPLFCRMIEALEAPWASEHLGFNRTGEGIKTKLFLPPLQTRAGAAAAAATIRRRQQALPVPFAVETGVNYLQPRAGELSDGAFLRTVVEAADCGILLDLHNLYANELNGRQPVRDFLAEIPLERVWEIHLAGGRDLDGYWLDAHSGPVPAPVLDLAAEVVPRLPNLGAMIFEILPTFLQQIGLDPVRRQIEKMDTIWRDRAPARSGSPQPATPRAPASPCGDETDPAVWENTLGALAVGRAVPGDLAARLRDDPGLAIMRRLIWNFRAGDIAGLLPLTTRALLRHLGEGETRALLDRTFAAVPPELFPTEEVLACADWLADQDIAVPFFAEALSYDRAVVLARAFGESSVVELPAQPEAFLGALAAGRLPEVAEGTRYQVDITP